jgi:hypothetical protein
VFSRLDQKSVFSQLGSNIQPDNLKVTAPDQRRKKRRTTQYAGSSEEHLSVNTISISFNTDQATDVNTMQTDDQSPPNQTHVTNTNKNNDRKGRSSKKK